jgi:predicted Zn-ribbon and HTH transcriptional regulator
MLAQALRASVSWRHAGLSDNDKGATGPMPAASRTARERIADALRTAELSAHELSQRVSVQEREVADHLQHLERSLPHAAEVLVVIPPRCIKCDFCFEHRGKLKRPSRCPRCKSERLSPPRFAIRPGRY